MRRIGITSTIPVEVVYAAGCVPVDLNNIFIGSGDPRNAITYAERQGFPRNVCGWIKGLYATALMSNIDALVAVLEGDCSQTQAMVETLQLRGLPIVPFSYPFDRNPDHIRASIHSLINALGTDWDTTVSWKRRLDVIRRKVRKLDDAAWQRGTVSSFDLHYYQVTCSDFAGDPDAFEADVDAKLAAVGAVPVGGGSQVPPQRARLGYIGVPPIFTDFYDSIDSLGARVVFVEVQRQFAMPFDTEDIVEQYRLYTYPYDVFAQIEDIHREVKLRKLDGLIHYTQSFCFRQIQDIVIRDRIHVPILTIEGDAPGPLDARTRMRIESFLEMLR